MMEKEDRGKGRADVGYVLTIAAKILSLSSSSSRKTQIIVGRLYVALSVHHTHFCEENAMTWIKNQHMSLCTLMLLTYMLFPFCFTFGFVILSTSKGPQSSPFFCC